MSCPDWRLLRSLQDRDPEAWARGLEHFDSCESCRDRALAAEPTLMFRRLPAPAVGDGDVAAMKQAVAVLRRSGARRSETGAAKRRLGSRTARLRAAAVAALLAGAVVLQGNVGRVAEVSAGDLEVVGVADTGWQPRPFAEIELPRVEDLPLIEAIDPSYGSVVQVVDDEISLVLVLPPTDDV